MSPKPMAVTLGPSLPNVRVGTDFDREVILSAGRDISLTTTNDNQFDEALAVSWTLRILLEIS